MELTADALEIVYFQYKYKNCWSGPSIVPVARRSVSKIARQRIKVTAGRLGGVFRRFYDDGGHYRGSL